MATWGLKRKRTSALPRWGAKRRRTTRYKRVGHRGRRTSTITGQSGFAKSFGYRGRRVRPRTWKRMLWRDTLQMSHYRSAFDTANALAAPLAVTSNSLPYLIPALPNVGFWTAAGGAQQIDAGVGPPNFLGDVTIRGGMIRLALTNESVTEAVRVRCWLLRSNKNPDLGRIPIAPTTVSTMFDPSIVPDFDEFGRIVMMREMTLLPVSNPMEIFYRLPIQKVDQAEYLQTSPTIAGGSQFYWYVLVSRMSLISNLIAPVIRAVSSHNLSFAADADT